MMTIGDLNAIIGYLTDEIDEKILDNNALAKMAEIYKTVKHQTFKVKLTTNDSLYTQMANIKDSIKKDNARRISLLEEIVEIRERRDALEKRLKDEN